MKIEPIYHSNEEGEFWECPLCGETFDSEVEAYEHITSEWLNIADTLIEIGQKIKRLWRKTKR